MLERLPPTTVTEEEEVLRLDARSTPGPWFFSEDHEPRRVCAGPMGHTRPCYPARDVVFIAGVYASGESIPLSEENTPLIARYRELAPRLVYTVRELRQAREVQTRVLAAERGEPGSGPHEKWVCVFGRWLFLENAVEAVVYRMPDIAAGWGWCLWPQTRDAHTEVIARGTAPTALEAMTAADRARAEILG